MNKSENYYNLDFLKIIFTVIVLLYHFIRAMGFWSEGGYAVELFFIISGFLGAKTFDKSLPFKDFIKKKISSFMPYLILPIIAMIPLKPFSIKAILNNLFLTPVFNRDLFILAAWYINIWFWLSLCLFYLQKTLKKEHVIGIVSLSVFISVCLMITYNTWLTWERIGFLNGGFYRGVAGMGAGYLLSLMAQKNEKNTSSLFYTVLEIFFLCYTVGCMFIKSWYISPYVIFISSCILILLFLQKKGILSRLTNTPHFGKLRKFTLPIYLLQHTPLGVFFILLPTHRSQYLSYPSLTIVITTLIMISWGILGYYITRLILILPALIRKYFTFSTH